MGCTVQCGMGRIKQYRTFSGRNNLALAIGPAALVATETLPAHSEAFQLVANEKRSVISSRAVGMCATGLLRGGYAAKGFHNKAGFVS